MAKLSTKFVAKLKHLVFKYKDDDVKMLALKRISWFSFPVVYPDFQEQYKVAEYKYLQIRAKRKRYRNHLRKMIDRYGTLYLVTLTFGDCYDSTNTDTRKKYVQRWLSDYTVDYFACLDIGKKGGREHYHCICALDTFFFSAQTFFALFQFLFELSRTGALVLGFLILQSYCFF